MAWTSANQFLQATLNHSYDMDNYPRVGNKYQCWDYADYFWVNQVGRMFVTKSGGGCVLDSWNISRVKNAGTEFSLITSFAQLQQGDWAVFGGSRTGHIGVVVSRNGNTVILQGQNQGTNRKIVNRITMASTYFEGAWRYKAWHQGTGFLPPKGYWTLGDTDPRIGTLDAFLAKTFPSYYPNEVKNLLGNYYGKTTTKWIREFQRRTGLVADGSTGRLTYAKLKEYGFNG